MKYQHAVKYNGKLYPAGADVPVGGKGRQSKGGNADETSGAENSAGKKKE